MRNYFRLLAAALLALVAGCSDDGGGYAANVALLAERLDEINDELPVDVEIPDDVLALLGQGFGGVSEAPSAAVRSDGEDLGAGGWSLGFAQAFIDSDGVEFNGTVGAGFRTENGTLEAFLFWTGDTAGGSTPEVSLYIDDLAAQDLSDGHVFVSYGEGYFFGDEQEPLEFLLDECAAEPLGEPPYRGTWLRSFTIYIALDFYEASAIPSAERAPAHDLGLSIGSAEEPFGPTDIPGFYLWDVCPPEE